MQGVQLASTSFGVVSRVADTFVHIDLDFLLSRFATVAALKRSDHLRRFACLTPLERSPILSFGQITDMSEHVLLLFNLLQHALECLVPSSMGEEALDLEHLTEDGSVIIEV